MPDSIFDMFKRKHTPAVSDNTRVNKIVPLRTLATTDAERTFLKRRNVSEPIIPIQNALRFISPLPGNVHQKLIKSASGIGNMNTKSLSAEDKAVLYRTVNNAVKRTGKLTGGTQYEDYNGAVDPDVYKVIRDEVKPATINPIKGSLLGYDPGFKMATTVGRMSYAVDPITKKVVITDNYDFVNDMTVEKDGSVKKGYLEKPTGDMLVDAYRGIRRDAALKDAKARTPEEKEKEFKKSRIQFLLSPADTIMSKTPARI